MVFIIFVKVLIFFLIGCREFLVVESYLIKKKGIKISCKKIFFKECFCFLLGLRVFLLFIFYCFYLEFLIFIFLGILLFSVNIFGILIDVF